MCRLDPDHDVLVLTCHVGGRLSVHVLGVLLDDLVAAHPVSDYVKQSENARPGAIDGPLLEGREISPAAGACVDNRGHSTSECVAVRKNAQLAVRIRASRATGEYM